MRADPETQTRIFSLLDLTSLNDTDSENNIRALCKEASSLLGHVAAVCVYPRFIREVVNYISGSPIKVATVANFPHGTDLLPAVVQSIEESLHAGADEIDVVFPYQAYIQGKRQFTRDFIAECKKAAGSHLLKVILETGALGNLTTISAASEDMLSAGADFLKTSTGKIQIGATMPAAEVMLTAIHKLKPNAGFKASGGIRTMAQAMAYIMLAERIFGKAWVTKEHFRLGTSRVLKPTFP